MFKNLSLLKGFSFRERCFVSLFSLLAVHFFCRCWLFISFVLIQKKRNQRKNQGCMRGATSGLFFAKGKELARCAQTAF
ncbi:MAG: hypothetical protein ACRC3Z_12790, partial [Phocaeicola sp.]